MIPLTAEHDVGPTLHRLRLDAGLTIRETAARAHISANGVHKRERSRAGYIGMFVHHARALGFDVALIPARHPHARPTGTGWPT